MSVFNWLFLGHLVGDWLLQNDWMAQGKRTGLLTWPGLAHFGVYTLTVLGIFYLFAGTGANLSRGLGLGFILFGSHWLIDATDVVDYWMRFYGQRNQAFVRIMIDQIFHLGVLAVLVALL